MKAEDIFQNPIFIVGMGRSGTTILEQAIGKHPQIVASEGESPFICRIGRLVYNYFCNQEMHDYFLNSLKIHLKKYIVL
jgi:hypothetical protein